MSDTPAPRRVIDAAARWAQAHELMRLIASSTSDRTQRAQPELRAVARAALAAASGSDTDPMRLALAVDSLRASMRRELASLVGIVATTALFDRSFQLAADEFPWLPVALPNLTNGVHSGVAADAAVLPEVAELAEGLAATLANDLALLSSAVGDDRMLQIVLSAWPEASIPGLQPRDTTGR